MQYKNPKRPLLTRRATHRVMPLEARLMFDAAAAADASRNTATDTAAAPDAAHALAAPAPAAPAATAAAETHHSLVATNAGVLGSTPQQSLTQALEQVNATLSRLPSGSQYAQLIAEVFGHTGTDAATFAQRLAQLSEALAASGLKLQVELRSNAELQGAYAAYAAHAPDGTERIYLNADWVNRGATQADIARVLLEETGHAIDQRLNAGVDTPGDEGERFSALVRGESIGELRNLALLADADQSSLTIDGAHVDVEFAELSVPFAEGFIGVQGNSSGKADNILNFATLGIVRASFYQDNGSNAFTAQGNDIPGGLRLTLSSGSVITLTGAVNWRVTQGSTLYCFGFIPDPATSPVSFSYGNGNTFTISSTSNFGLELVGVNYSAADNSNISGNAATNGLLTALNTYLATVQANDPNGPVTVNTLSTTSTTPALTGSVTLAGGESLSVQVNGVTYTTGSGLTVGGGSWSLTIPNGNALTAGTTYSVLATIVNGSGYTLNDSSTNELQILVPDNTAPVVTANQSFSYAENQSSGTTLGTVAATDAVGVTGYRFSSTGTTTSADGYYSINASGQISLTTAGAAAAPNDYESTPNGFTYGIQARDAAGNWSSAVNVTLNETDVDDTAPVVAASQSFSYAENRASGAVLGTVSATDAVGVTGYRFSSTGTTTSSDGYYSLNASGQISLTTAGAAAAANDYETLPNSFTHAVQARDAAGNWSAAVNVTLNVTDVDDTAPVVTASQSFSYAENQSSGTTLGTVAATDAVGVTGYRFSGSGTTTSADGYYSINASGQVSLTTAGAAAAANDYETLPNSFTYGVQARDAAGNWSSAVNVTFDVTDVNESLGDSTPPVVAPGQSFSYAENQTPGTVLGTVAATDANGVTGYRFSGSGTTTSADGFYSINTSGQISLTTAGAAAAANDYETLPDSFTHGVQARDAAGNWSSAVNVTLNVTDVNEATVTPDQLQVAEDTPATGNVLSNDPGGPASVVSFSVGGTSVAAGSSLNIAGVGSITIAANGNFTFTPLPDWHGSVPTVSYTTDHGQTSVLNLTVASVNDAPSLTPDALTTFQEVPWQGQLPAGTDADGDSLSYSLVQGPQHGSVSLDSAGHYVYTPVAGYAGADRFRVEVSDGQGGSAQVWVDVTVEPSPTLTLPAPWDLGVSSTDRTTSADVITLAGGGTPGQTLQLYSPAGQLIGTTVVDSNGQWSVAGIDMRTTRGDASSATAGAPGAYTFTLRAALPGGTLSAPVQLTVQREVAVVAAPAEPAPAPAPAPTAAPAAPAAPAAAPEPVAVAAPEPRPAFDSTLRPESRPDGQLLTARAQEPAAQTSFGLPARESNAADIYTRPSGFQIMVNPSPEPSLKLFRGLDDQVAKLGSTVQLQVPADTFVHTNINETVVLQATLADGRPLPRWLQFDGRTGTINGDVPAEWREDVVIRVIARDSQGREASAMMRLKVSAGTVGSTGLSRQLMQGRGTPIGAAARAPARA